MNRGDGPLVDVNFKPTVHAASTREGYIEMMSKFEGKEVVVKIQAAFGPGRQKPPLHGEFAERNNIHLYNSSRTFQGCIPWSEREYATLIDILYDRGLPGMNGMKAYLRVRVLPAQRIEMDLENFLPLQNW